MAMPMPRMRFPDASGQPEREPHPHPTPGMGFGHPRSGRSHPHHGHNQMHRGHHHRHHHRRPWYMPQWLFEMQLAQMEQQQLMNMEMGGLSLGGFGGNMGMGGAPEMDDSGSDLDLPRDASEAFENQLSGSPDLAGQHNRHHKHHHKKRHPNEDTFRGRGGAQDEGISGKDSIEGTQSQPQSGGLTGGFSGQTPIDNAEMYRAMQPNTYKRPNGMDQGAMQSSDHTMSQDIEQAGPYDDMSTGYEIESNTQGSPYGSRTDTTYTSLSDPNYQPNPWGFGSG